MLGVGLCFFTGSAPGRDRGLLIAAAVFFAASGLLALGDLLVQRRRGHLTS